MFMLYVRYLRSGGKSVVTYLHQMWVLEVSERRSAPRKSRLPVLLHMLLNDNPKSSSNIPSFGDTVGEYASRALRVLEICATLTCF
jgi:hypothetical protein